MISSYILPTTEDGHAEQEESVECHNIHFKDGGPELLLKEQVRNKTLLNALKHTLTHTLHFSFRITSSTGDGNRLMDTRRYASW